MGKVFVDSGITLDGYIAGPNGGAANPLGDNGIKIHEWMFKQKAFMDHLNLPGSGETGVDNDLINKTFDRIGANIMGNKMFIEGEANWPEEAPFHCPVYVLTHQKREPWERPGGTTFYFTNEDIRKVLEIAKKDAAKKDVRISGGANVVQQYLNAGLVDELVLHVAPIFLDKGIRLFENIKKEIFDLQINEVISSPTVTHIFYKITNQNTQ